jgi:hypothetical protein
MLTIAALVDRKRSFAPRPTRSPVLREIDTMPQLSALMTDPAIFERRVFQCLVKGGQVLRTKTVLAAESMSIDGGLVLRDGRFVAIEMKRRMNWLKTCQAGWQFEKFFASVEGRRRPPRRKGSALCRIQWGLGTLYWRRRAWMGALVYRAFRTGPGVRFASI